jgi:hypothetical protein
MLISPAIVVVIRPVLSTEYVPLILKAVSVPPTDL